jgi:hypothetical protein
VYLDDGELLLQSCYCLNTVSNEAGTDPAFIRGYECNAVCCVVTRVMTRAQYVCSMKPVALMYSLYRFLF